MHQSTSVFELNRDSAALSEEERLRFAEEFLVATSLGWEQVMSLLQSYVRDPETQAMLDELLAA